MKHGSYNTLRRQGRVAASVPIQNVGADSAGTEFSGSLSRKHNLGRRHNGGFSAPLSISHHHEGSAQRRVAEIMNNGPQAKKVAQMQAVMHGTCGARETLVLSRGATQWRDAPTQLHSSNVVQLMSQLDIDTRQLAKNEVIAGRSLGAALWIFHKYGFRDRYPNAKVVAPESNLKHHESDELVFAATTGVVDAGEKQKITFNKEQFEALVLSDNEDDWARLVSAFGHECEHSAQRSGTDERSGNRPVTIADEAEFLSYSWEALGLSPGPALPDEILLEKSKMAVRHWNSLLSSLKENEIQLSDGLKIQYEALAFHCHDIMTQSNKRVAAKTLQALRDRIHRQTQAEIASGLRYKNGKFVSYGTSIPSNE